LIRNCYLNPVVYSKYRTYWTRAGFRVIDCPSLTQRHNAGADSSGRVPEAPARPGHSEVENHGSLTRGP
ncbi:MAG TPA: hypothetical protein VLR70_14745, partial [Arthrobacter sp.]|nr:hypothetical protein [Arthrobacter sp.]